MTDRRTPDPAEQLCTGQNGGHVPFVSRVGQEPTATLDQYYADVPGYPDLQLYYLHAAERIPCLGRFVRNADTGYAVVDNVHIQIAAIHLKPPTKGSGFKGANFPLIAAQRDDSGRIRITDTLDGFSEAQKRRIRAGWRVAYSGLAKIPGRHAVDLDAHIAELRANYWRLKPLCAQQGHPLRYHPTHPECLQGTNVTIEASRERLRPTGLSWTKRKEAWEHEGPP